uniref:Uncharacterized protein n=1 Tax=Arundo donax TaxID=35708 RepID=A0A0A9DJF2_ARUDO
MICWCGWPCCDATATPPSPIPTAAYCAAAWWWWWYGGGAATKGAKAAGPM